MSTDGWQDYQLDTLDDSMIPEDDDLQGASCIVGGFCRGKAVGNAPAFVDLESGTGNTVQQLQGRVFLHLEEDSASYSMLHPVGSD